MAKGRGSLHLLAKLNIAACYTGSMLEAAGILHLRITPSSVCCGDSKCKATE